MAQVDIAIIPVGAMVVVLVVADLVDLAVEADLAAAVECPAAAVPLAAGKKEWIVK